VKGTTVATDYTEVLSGTNDDVNDYISQHPDEREAVLAAEADGQGRKGILEGPHAEAPDERTNTEREADEQAASSGHLTTKGETFDQAAEAATPDPKGYWGQSPEAERTGRRDKGLSQKNPAVMNQGGNVPDPSPYVDDSEAIAALKADKD
jgi:hypothetical protein